MSIPFPSQANFLITPKCNCNCLFCLNDWREDSYDPTEEMSLEEKQSAIKALRDNGVDFLVITGGEPALDAHLIEVLAYARSLGMSMVMQTNGMFLDKKRVRSMAPYLLGLQVSIEGLKRNHNKVTRGGDFDKSIQGIRNALAVGLVVQVNTTMTKFNHKEMERFVPFLKDLGVHRLNLIRLYYAGNAIKHHDRLFLSKDEMQSMIHSASQSALGCGLEIHLQGAPLTELHHGHEGIKGCSGCGAAVSEITLNYNGNVSVCPSWNKSFGNVKKDSLQTLWDSKEFEMVRKREFGAACTSCPLSLMRKGDEYANNSGDDTRIDVRSIVGGTPIFKRKENIAQMS